MAPRMLFLLLATIIQHQLMVMRRYKLVKYLHEDGSLVKKGVVRGEAISHYMAVVHKF
jgi:hypothetical protein